MASSGGRNPGVGEGEEFHSEHMSVMFQRGFKQLLDSGDFVDVTVCVENERFQLHKSVLCATIPYFQSLFLSSFKESSDDEISLAEITASGFREVIKFVYTGKLHISDDNIQEVLQTADLLQVDEALILCDNFLLKSFHKINNADSCKFSLRDIYCLSTLYHRLDLTETVLYDIKCTAGECPGVYDLPKDAIVNILSDNSSVFWDEDDALYFAKNWLLVPDVSGLNRLELAEEVLSKVRLRLVSRECLEKEIRQDDAFKAVQGLEDFIQEKLKDVEVQEGCNILMLDLPQRHRDCNLDNHAVVILSDTCGFSKSLESFPSVSDIRTKKSKLKVESFIIDDSDSFENFFRNVATIESPPVADGLFLDLHAETISQYLFCVTSYLDATETRYTVITNLFAYDFLTKVWCKLSQPNVPRVHFSVVSHNKCLYIIGGQLADSTFTAHVEMYNPKTDSWKNLRSLPKATAHCQSLSCRGDLYVIGGLTASGPSRSIFHLRTGTLEWEVFAPSSHPFLAHRVLFQEPYIIVLNADPRCVSECRENYLVAFYNIDTKKWIRPQVKRKTTMALKTDCFSNPTLEMVTSDDAVTANCSFVFQESKISVVFVRVCGLNYSELGDLPERFEMVKVNEKQLERSCRLIAATVVKSDG